MFTQRHPRVKERQSQEICDTRPTSPTPRGHCCARCVRYRVCCFIDRSLWLFPTTYSTSTPHETNPPCTMHNPPHNKALLNELSTQEVSQSWTEAKNVVFQGLRAEVSCIMVNPVRSKCSAKRSERLQKCDIVSSCCSIISNSVLYEIVLSLIHI